MSQGDNHAEESFGWIDRRDGSPGPKGFWMEPLAPGMDPATGQAQGSDPGYFPCIGGRAARCPMYVMAQPPCATKMTTVYNPLTQDYNNGGPPDDAPFQGNPPDWATITSYANPDPQPAGAPAGYKGIGMNFDAWRRGDPTPRPGSDLAWFRVYRMTQADCLAHRQLTDLPAPLHYSYAVFTITCGAGGTRGFKDWNEVLYYGQQDLFADDKNLFDELRAQERILWFACEWTSAVGTEGCWHYLNPGNGYGGWDMGGYNHAPSGYGGPGAGESPTPQESFGGTFRWIERLAQPPANW